MDAPASRAPSRRVRPPKAHSPLVPAWAVAMLLGSAAAWLLSQDWIAALGIWVLLAGWRYLRVGIGSPVLALAFTFQWVQVMAGVYYHAVTRSPLPAMDLLDYRPMLLIGLGCLVALLIGLVLGIRWAGGAVSADAVPESAAAPAIGWRPLIALYAISVVGTGTLQELAWEIPAFTQGILALSYARLALLFLIMRRLCRPRVRWGVIGMLLALEVALGFTGYFAGFREPLMMAAMALIGVFDPRRPRHWAVMGALAAAMLVTGVLWMGIRGEYRQDLDTDAFTASREARLQRVAGLASRWATRDPAEIASDIEAFVDRLWAVYYPALAVQRVPEVLPHENGAILGAAVKHLFTPRLLFPDKPELESDSELVRKYSGVPVAGPEQNTSIAFGYAAESYVDFGVPVMWVPVLLYGLLMGMAYAVLPRLIKSRELGVAAVTVIFWLSLHLFERSWVRTLGGTVTLLVYLGGATLLADRALAWWQRASARMRGLRASRRAA